MQPVNLGIIKKKHYHVQYKNVYYRNIKYYRNALKIQRNQTQNCAAKSKKLNTLQQKKTQ